MTSASTAMPRRDGTGLSPRRFLAPLLALLLIAAVGGGIWRFHARLGSDQAAQANRQAAAAQHVAIRGLIGSEKEDFMR